MTQSQTTDKAAFHQDSLRQPVRALMWFSLATNVLLLAVPLHMLQVYDRVLSSKSLETLVYLTLIVFLALAAYGIAESLRGKLAQRLSNRFTLSYADPIFHFLVHDKTNRFHSDQVLRDLNMVRAFLAGRQFINLFDLPFFPLYLVLMFLLHITLGFVAVLGIGLMIMVAILNDKMTKTARENSQSTKGEASAFSQAVMTHTDDIRAMGLLPAIMERWGSKTAASLNSADDAAQHTARFYGISRFVRQSLQVFVMAWGAFLVLQGDMSGGMIFASTMLLGKVLMPVEQLIGGWDGIITAKKAYHGLADIVALSLEQPKLIHLPAPKGHLSVENLIYHPDEAQEGRPILDRVSFNLNPGKILAVIGASGAGKSTLAKLIVGAKAPSSGVIRLDQFDIEQWPAAQRGQAIGYVPQDIMLFPGTIAENIARLETNLNEAKIVKAAQMAGVHDMIAQLSDGYSTVISPQKMPLSGGQRQRIALARAFYANPKILVLDEPNAHLDQAGEAILMRSLQNAKQMGTAVLIVSQRHAILKIADQIMTIEAGKVASMTDNAHFHNARRQAVPKAGGQMPPMPQSLINKLQANPSSNLHNPNREV